MRFGYGTIFFASAVASYFVTREVEKRARPRPVSFPEAWVREARRKGVL